MTNEDRLLAALEYQRAMQPAFGNPNLMRQGQRMNLPARQVPGPVSAFGTQAVSFDQQQDQGYGTMAAEMALGFVPGVGQAMALRDIERARRDDDPLGMALAGLSLVPFGKMIGAMRGGKQVGPVSQLDVYHGSPHRFPPTAKNPLGEFDASKIGTGEGAQAYGHGLYLAEARGVADEYAGKLSQKTVSLRGMTPNKDQQAILDRFSAGANVTQYGEYRPWDALQNVIRYGSPSEKVAAKQLEKEAGFLGRNFEVKDSGSLYKVDLPDAQILKMLDFNNPLKDQSPEIQKAMQDLVKTDVLGRPTGISVDPNMNGQWAYERLAGIRGAKYAAEAMREAGIPGIRYLDQGSRAGGKGTSNFVVFPGSESMLTILERNNQNVGNMLKPTVPAPSLMYKDPFGSTY